MQAFPREMVIDGSFFVVYNKASKKSHWRKYP